MPLTAKPVSEAPYTLTQYKRFCRLIIERNGSELWCWMQSMELEMQAALRGTIQTDVDQYGNDARNKTRKIGAMDEWLDEGKEQIRDTIYALNFEPEYAPSYWQTETWEELSEVEQKYVKPYLNTGTLLDLEI